MADTKDHGNITIKLKHDNTIKKNAAPDNPAVHVERSNDVVKRASELNVEKASDSASSKKREHKKEEGDGTITVRRARMSRSRRRTKRILRLKGRRRTPRQDMKNRRTSFGGRSRRKNLSPGALRVLARAPEAAHDA